MLDDGSMAKARAEIMQHEREEVHAALQYAASFLYLVEEWTVESSSRSQKKSGLSWTRKERRRNIERNGVLKPAGIDA